MISFGTIALALGLAAFQQPPANRQETERLPVEFGPQEEDLSGLKPGFDPFHPVPPRPLSQAPLRVSSNNLLHSLFGFLPLESAETIEEARFDVGLYQDVSSGAIEETTPDYFLRYDATLVETHLAARLGLYQDWEVAAGVDVSDLLEDEGDIILARRGSLLIREGRRHAAVGDVRLFAKKRLFSVGQHGATGLAVGAKIPVSRSKTDLLTSGGVDLAASLLFSQELGPFTVHLNLGAIVPGDIELFEEHVETRNALTFGVATACQLAPWAMLAAQLQGNQSVFSDSSDSIEILDETVYSIHGGGRFRLGSYVLEVSAGTGLGDQTSEWVLTLSLSLPL